MAKSWEEIKKERMLNNKASEIVRPKIYDSRPTKSFDTDRNLEVGALTARKSAPLATVEKKSWLDVKKERGYIEPVKEPVNQWKENPLKSFGSNAVAGFGDLGRAGANIVDMTLGDKNIPFIDNYLANIKTDTQAEDERLNKINSSSKAGEILGGISRGIGQAGTSVAMGVAGAPLAGANPLLTAGGTRLVSNAATLANPTNLMTAQKVITDMAKNPNFVPSMVQGVGSQYEQAINKGASREQAFNAALIGGVPSGLIEMSGGLETLSAKLANKTKGLFGQALQNALEEGLEEVIQYPIENAGQKIAYDKNMPFFSTKQDAIINPGEMAKAGFIGGAVGGIMGGGAQVINNSVNKNYQKNLNTQYENIVSRLPEESTTLQKVNELKKNNVNIDDDVKRFVVEQGKRDLGIDEEFQSETDNVLRNIEPTNQSMQNESKPIEQTFNDNRNIVKTQNNALQSNQEIHIENVNNPSEVKSKMYNYLQNSVISTSEISKPIVNTNSGLKVEVSRATINQTLGKDKAYIESKDKQIKLAALADIETLISNGKINVVDNSNIASSKTTYATLTAPVTLKGETQNVTMDIRRTDNGNRYFVHSIKTAESKTSGVIDNNVSSTINRQAYTALDKLGQATGIKIKIVESIDSPDGTRKDIANGQFVGDTLEISKSSDNPLLEVAKHEITHALQVQSPKLYEEYKTYVIDSMKQNDSKEYENAFNDIKDLHRINGIKISDSAIEDEIVADATDRFLTDENSIKELAKNNLKLGQKILDIIREFIKTVQDSVRGISRLLNAEQLNKAEQLWVNALNDAIENKKVVEVQKEAAIVKNSLKDTNKKFSLKDSKGNTLTKEQQEFFKDSKVRDKDGNLLVVYHGTKSDFNTFTPSKGGEYGSGIYLTDLKDTAMWYAKNVSRGEENPRIVETYVNMVNPYIIDKMDYIKKTENTTPNTLKKKLIKQGYDGIIGIGINGYEKQYVAFNPNRIKNIDNLKPTENEDIRFSLKDRLKGDALLDAEDLIEEIKSNGGKVNENGYVTVYHATSKINADEILKTKKMKAKEDGLFFSTKSDGQINGYGNTIIKMSIPIEKLILDDVFGDEAHLRIPLRSKNQVLDIKDYIVDDKEAKFQLKNNNKDIERLRTANERLKEQFKLTKGVKLDERAIKRASKAILKEYSSKYNVAELDSRISNLYSLIANDEIDFDEMAEETQSIARDILENVKVLDDEMYRKYTELRQTLRNTPIMINDRYENDFRAVGTFAEFKKKNRGRINIVKENGVDVDKFYQELSDRYPDLFIKDIANPADQLMTIEEVLDSLIPVYENPYNADMNTAVELLGVELFENFTNIPEAKKTFADKKKAELDKVKANSKDKIAIVKQENKDRIKEILANEKTKRDSAIEKNRNKKDLEAYKTWWKTALNEKDTKSYYQKMVNELRTKKNDKIEETASRYKERIGNIYEDRHVREAKASIQRKVKKLNAMLLKPTDKKHIPKELNKSIAELLAQIDFATDRQKEKKVLELLKLRAKYETMAAESGEDGIEATADPEIMQFLLLLNDKRLADMDLSELQMLDNVISYFDKMVSSYNKAFLNGKYVYVSERAEKALDEFRVDKPKDDSAYPLIAQTRDMFNVGMIAPLTYFKRMGSTFYSLWKDLRLSLDSKIIKTKITQDYMKKLLYEGAKGEARKEKSKDIKSWTGDKAKITTFKLESGITVEFTPSQVMSIYLLWKREQARGHILGLGIEASPIVEKDRKGIKHVKKQYEPAKVTPIDIATIVNTLTPSQKRIADGIGVFMNTYAKQWYNETSLKINGYEKAKEENYFPIVSVKDFLKSDFDNTNVNTTFANMASLKNTVKGANNAIVIEDVFDVFTKHADEASTYNSFAMVTETIRKIVNYKTQTESIKRAMNKKYGTSAFTYLQKLMVDLQGGLRTDRGMPIVNSLIRVSKRAMLGLNVRTAIQQPIAIVRAAAMIDVKYLLKGTALKGNIEEMRKYSPIAMWKSWGYFNLDTGRTMKDIILDTQPFFDRQYFLIQKADDIAWSKLWNATKLEIEDLKPELEKGSQEYFDAVNERFSDIIDNTQVVDTVLHRSDMMRDKDSYVKVVTSFMSEPTKLYNMAFDAISEYSKDKSEANKKNVLRTMSSLVASISTVALVVAIYEMLHKDDKDEEDTLDKWLQNMVDNVVGITPIARDIYSIMQGYDVNRMEYTGIVKVWRSGKRFSKYLEEVVKKERHDYQIGYIVTDLAESVSFLFGVSTANVTREIEAILKKYIDVSGSKDGIADNVYDTLFKKK